MTAGEHGPFRFGVLGTGNIAAKFVAELSQVPGVELYAVASASQARADAFAKAHGATRGYAPHAALLADAAVDAVYVATPSRDHLAHCTAALQADLPVLCEKPLALTRQEGEAIAGLAGERGVFCMEAMWMRFHPRVQALRAWIAEGKLGEVSALRASLGWAKGAERVERPELGHGAALDFGVYPLSLAHYLLGTPEAFEVSVDRHPSGVDRAFTAELRYPGCVATLSASVAAELDNGAVVEGTLGTATLDRPLISPRGLHLSAPGRGPSLGRRVLGRLAPALTGASVPHGVGFRREAEELVACVRAGRSESETVPLSATLQVLSWVDEIRGSALAGRPD